MRHTIVGKWRVIDSNRPLSNDYNSNAIGSFGMFLENGVHFIILKEGQKFKLNYTYDVELNILELVFSDGGKRKFEVEIMAEPVKRMMVTDMATGFFDSYEFVAAE